VTSAADLGTGVTGAVQARQRRRRRPLTREVVETRILEVLRWVGIAFFLIITIVPFYYMFMLSVRTIESFAANPGTLIPSLNTLTLDTYSEVLKGVNEGGQGFLTFMRNSLLIAVVAVIVSLGIAIPGAYAISRLRFFGRRTVSVLFLSVYLFPAILLAIPLFVLFTKLGLRGSIFGLMLVYASQTVPVSIYMLKTYFDSVPVSLEESAAVEGATRFQILTKVSLPLSAPAIMATGLFIFMIAWNEFLFALLFLVEKRDSWTVSLGLSQLAGSIEVPTTVLMAGSVILTVPIIVLFFLTERFLVEGLTAGAEKG
jgi:multiple sugar transport system permease protein